MENTFLNKKLQNKEIKKGLRTQNELFSKLIEHSSQGISAFDENVTCIVWNKIMEINTGVEKAKVLGKNIFETLPQLRAEYYDLSIKVLGGQKIVLRNKKYILRKGNYDIDLIPLFNDQKKVIGGFAIVQDVTERMKHEEQNTKQKLNQQKEVMDIILYTQEEERKRIAEGLHNGLGQLLYAMKLNLDTLQINSDKPKEISVKKEIELLLDEVIEQVRTISFELMPAVLNDFGLETAIRELCLRLSKGELKIYYKFSLSEKIESPLEIAIFRIIQELVNNIMKHSSATKGYISVKGAEKSIVIHVKDNGQGFDTQFLDKATGIGICSIRNRIKLINGEFNIVSSPGNGTEVIIKIQKL